MGLAMNQGVSVVPVFTRSDVQNWKSQERTLGDRFEISKEDRLPAFRPTRELDRRVGDRYACTEEAMEKKHLNKSDC